MQKLFFAKKPYPANEIFNRYYWFQIALIALIALSIMIGIVCSAWVIKGFLLKAALE